MPQVALCKTRGPVHTSDPYHERFEAIGYEVDYVQVIQEEYHIDELAALLNAREDRKWAGVVITSKRGAEGWIRAVQASSRSVDAGDAGSGGTDWSQVTLFTVGSSSLDYLSAYHDGDKDHCGSSLPRQFQLNTTDAIHARSASDLLPLLLAHGDTTIEQSAPYLIIRGDKTTDELQQGLKEAKREWHEVTVYATSARPTLADDIQLSLRELQRSEEDKGWIVFFSPSSAEMVFDSLESRVTALDDLYIAAIGQTTGDYLKRQRGITVHAVAQEPTAEGLLRAIQAYDTSKGG